MSDDKRWVPKAHEPEFKGSIWKHPYMVYIYLTAVLAICLGLIGYLAWTNGWIPNRGISR